MEIGERIKQARKSAGLTQKELADLSGVSVVTLQQYERGVRKQPKLEQLDKLARALNVSIGVLSGNTPEKDHESIFVERAIALMDTLRSQNLLAPEFEPYYSMLQSGDISLTEKIAISNSLQVLTNVSIDYLFGYTDEPNTVLRSLPSEYSDLTISILEADDDLLSAVHSLCGMDTDLIASDIITGDITTTWNPKKIYVIRDFLVRNESSIKALIATKMNELSEK